jgi:hypothetical protein
MFSSFKKDFEATSLAYSLKFSKNKGGRTTLTIAFLLSFDLRDYPLKDWDLSPSVSKSTT